MESLLEIIASPLMIGSAMVLGFSLLLVLREYKTGLTGEQKQARNRKIRSEYGKSIDGKTKICPRINQAMISGNTTFIQL